MSQKRSEEDDINRRKEAYVRRLRNFVESATTRNSADSEMHIDFIATQLSKPKSSESNLQAPERLSNDSASVKKVSSKSSSNGHLTSSHKTDSSKSKSKLKVASSSKTRKRAIASNSASNGYCASSERADYSNSKSKKRVTSKSKTRKRDSTSNSASNGHFTPTVRADPINSKSEEGVTSKSETRKRAFLSNSASNSYFASSERTNTNSTYIIFRSSLSTENDDFNDMRPPKSPRRLRVSDFGGTDSPLPDLIVVKETGTQHDEPLEFYQKLLKKMLKFSKRLVVDGDIISNVSSDTSDASSTGKPRKTDYLMYSFREASVGIEVTPRSHTELNKDLKSLTAYKEATPRPSPGNMETSSRPSIENIEASPRILPRDRDISPILLPNRKKQTYFKCFPTNRDLTRKYPGNIEASPRPALANIEESSRLFPGNIKTSYRLSPGNNSDVSFSDTLHSTLLSERREDDTSDESETHHIVVTFKADVHAAQDDPTYDSDRRKDENDEEVQELDKTLRLVCYEDTAEASNGQEIMEENAEKSDGQEVLEENAEASSGEEVLEDNAEASNGEEVLKENAEASNGEEVMEENVETSDGEEVMEENAEDSNGEEVLEDNAEASNREEVIEEYTEPSNGHEVLEENAEASNGEETLEDSADANDSEEVLEDNAEASNGEKVLEENAEASDGEEVMEENTEPSDGQQILEKNADLSNGEGVLEENDEASVGEEMLEDNAVPSNGEEVLEDNAEPSNSQGVLEGNAEASDGEEVMEGNAEASDGEEVMEENAEERNGEEVLEENAEASNGDEVLEDNAEASDDQEVLEETTVSEIDHIASKEIIEEMRSPLPHTDIGSIGNVPYVEGNTDESRDERCVQLERASTADTNIDIDVNYDQELRRSDHNPIHSDPIHIQTDPIPIHSDPTPIHSDPILSQGSIKRRSHTPALAEAKRTKLQDNEVQTEYIDPQSEPHYRKGTRLAMSTHDRAPTQTQPKHNKGARNVATQTRESDMRSTDAQSGITGPRTTNVESENGSVKIKFVGPKFFIRNCHCPDCPSAKMFAD